MMQYYTHRQIMKNSLFKQSPHAACSTENQYFTSPPHVPQHSACCLNHACFDDGNYSNFRIAFSLNAISHACMEIDFGVPTHMACRLRRMCNCEVQYMRYICDKYPFLA